MDHTYWNYKPTYHEKIDWKAIDYLIEMASNKQLVECGYIDDSMSNITYFSINRHMLGRVKYLFWKHINTIISVDKAGVTHGFGNMPARMTPTYVEFVKNGHSVNLNSDTPFHIRRTGEFTFLASTTCQKTFLCKFSNGNNTICGGNNYLWQTPSGKYIGKEMMEWAMENGVNPFEPTEKDQLMMDLKWI